MLLPKDVGIFAEENEEEEEEEGEEEEEDGREGTGEC